MQRGDLRRACAQGLLSTAFERRKQPSCRGLEVILSRSSCRAHLFRVAFNRIQSHLILTNRVTKNWLGDEASRARGPARAGRRREPILPPDPSPRSLSARLARQLMKPREILHCVRFSLKHPSSKRRIRSESNAVANSSCCPDSSSKRSHRAISASLFIAPARASTTSFRSAAGDRTQTTRREYMCSPTRDGRIAGYYSLSASMIDLYGLPETIKRDGPASPYLRRSRPLCRR